MVHPLGFVKSRRDLNSAPLGFCEVAVGPQWYSLGVLCSRGAVAYLGGCSGCSTTPLKLEILIFIK